MIDYFEPRPSRLTRRTLPLLISASQMCFDWSRPPRPDQSTAMIRRRTTTES
ncbi:MAG: hypothetical protein ABR521_09250 [Gaiellaceae bacterium]